MAGEARKARNQTNTRQDVVVVAGQRQSCLSSYPPPSRSTANHDDNNDDPEPCAVPGPGPGPGIGIGLEPHSGGRHLQGGSRVNLKLCLSQLGHHRESPDADVWGLAKVASLVGANNADDIKQMMGPSPALAQEAISLTHQCDAAFGKAKAKAKVPVPVPPPLAQRNADSVQIAIIATAITNLITNIK
ncbi:hypothetical protein U9M48_005748 [Paspalum notatum var. saurae]|uniref:Pectinesterase inhibitor domain-containing protein n=1 Tax=Paspalum notatum var. saurae TaxID=547442 RepID=A0AAQ3PQU5_PASNO